MLNNNDNDNNDNETYILESVNIEIESKQLLYSWNMDKDRRKTDLAACVSVSLSRNFYVALFVSRCLQTSELLNECFCSHLLYSFTVPFTVSTEYEYC